MDAFDIDALPYLDEHQVLVAGSPDQVWESLGHLSFSGRVAEAYARLIGCEDTQPSGPRPLAEGSAFPGFHVVESDPSRRLVLAGRHHFAHYALTFRLEPAGPSTTRLSAESRTAFPGARGRIYRFLLMSSGAHVISVRHMLKSVRRRAEAHAPTG